MDTCKTSFIFSFLIVFFLSSCGGGGGGGTPETPETVEQTLTDLGVDIADTPREDRNGDPLPDDYTPLGSSKSFDQLDELVMIGFQLDASTGNTSQLNLLELNRVGTSASYTDEVLFSPDTADTPWALSVGATPTALRVAGRGDVDQDGLEELLIVYRAPGQDNVELQLYEDEIASFAKGQNLVISTDPVDSLAVAVGDYNGDGYAELVIGLVSGNSAQLVFVDNNEGVLSLSTLNKTLPQAYPGSEINLVIKSGNLDYDPSDELVVLVNERILEAGNPESGTTRYFVFDDAKKDHIALSNALVQSTEVNRTAIVADVSLADVDGDNIDEIVFAGLTHFDPAGTCSYTYLLMVLDDLVHDNESLGDLEHQTTIHGGCAASKGELRFVHVNTPDLDGDGIPEIQANELIFDDFRLTAWAPLYDIDNVQAKIPHDSLFSNASGFTGRFSQQNSTIVVADLTADERQDVIFYSQSTNRLEVWGLSVLDTDPLLGIEDGQWRMLKSIAIEPPPADELRPILVPVNVNHDGLAISLEQGSYQLVFTEPILIAALAAAPCYDNLGQNTDACRTTYGTAESSTIAFENTTTITAGVSVGTSVTFNVPVTAIKIGEISAKLKVSASLSLSHSSSYTYTESVVYTTGPMEDTVIFTSIPYDIYTYTITSHPDPDVMGTEIVVSMPRSPVTLQVERSFYNANVVHGGPLIDSSVFSHSAGDPTSYPGSGEKDTTVSDYSDPNPLVTPTQWAYEVGPEVVGQGTGETYLGINVVTESGFAVAIGVEAEFEMELTAGIIVAGFSIGISNETSLQVSHGTESIYGGTVGNLPTSEFAANGYGWGLFTYVMDDHASGQHFEVINYWVQ